MSTSQHHDAPALSCADWFKFKKHKHCTFSKWSVGTTHHCASRQEPFDFCPECFSSSVQTCRRHQSCMLTAFPGPQLSVELLKVKLLLLLGPASPDESLDKPISTGMRRRRRSSSTDCNDPLMFTPGLTKQLKLYVMKVAEEKDVDEQHLMDFTGGIAYMLIDIKATLMVLSAVNRRSLLTESKDLIESKDFKVLVSNGINLSPTSDLSSMTQSGLHNCLTACVLSPNLTANVNDTLEHVMEFIKKNSEIFKVPKFLFEDIELTAQLSKLVSEALACIHGNIKSKLMTSISKRSSIIDTARSLAHGCLEIDVSHWNRYAFLWHCLRIFLIGTGNHKNIPLKDIYSLSLLPSLHRDLRVKVGNTLGIDVGLDDFDPDPIAESPTNKVHENGADSMGDIEGSMNGAEAGDDGTFDINHDGDNDADDEDDPEGNVSGTAEKYELDPNDSGFGGNGKHTIFMSTKFWRFVDASLEGVRKMGKAEAEKLNDGTPVENVVRNILVEFFQQDLAEFPGKRTVPKLLSNTNPQWQMKIQTDLLW
ncbi:uncharacterized protein EDB91DRAFT_1247944 [Suillus paluster]|uniref:uncharacterized protein n=1 Tax=Suillus paluster TaxID=48578 RepID=UPI001B874294|nr:uncharacterized protein EDB91DRAFT_1247944 [Suillus paluster]KAG1741901.1 hypothetical protein EDB91DRAFT_1247944 [Suillus paluster]